MCCWTTWISSVHVFHPEFAGVLSARASREHCTRAGGGHPGSGSKDDGHATHRRIRRRSRCFGAAPLAAPSTAENKVQYQAFDFRIIPTEHSSIYYYPGRDGRPLDARACGGGTLACPASCTTVEDHLYASQSGLPADHTTAKTSARGTGGFTESSSTGWCCPIHRLLRRHGARAGHEMVPSSSMTDQPRRNRGRRADRW